MSNENAPLRTRRITYPKAKREEAFRMFAARLSLDQIASKLGITRSTIGAWSMQGKWQVRRLMEATQAGLAVRGVESSSDNVQKRDNVLNNNTSVQKDYTNLTLSEAQGEYEDRAHVQALRIMDIIESTSDTALFLGADKLAKLDATARKALKLEDDKPKTLINIALLSHGTLEPVRNLSAKPSLTYEEQAGSKPAAARVTEANEASPGSPAP